MRFARSESERGFTRERPVVDTGGADECAANTIEACAMHLYPEPWQYTPFVTCFEGEHHSNMSFVEACAEQAGIPAAPILECFEDKERLAKIEGEMARAEGTDVGQRGALHVIRG